MKLNWNKLRTTLSFFTNIVADWYRIGYYPTAITVTG